MEFRCSCSTARKQVRQPLHELITDTKETKTVTPQSYGIIKNSVSKEILKLRKIMKLKELSYATIINSQTVKEGKNVTKSLIRQTKHSLRIQEVTKAIK